MMQAWRARAQGCVGSPRASAPAAPPRAPRAAFTLIELLVVVAILALLLSILAPSTKFAYETTQSLTCRTKMYGGGQAFSDFFQPYLGSYEFFYCPSEKARSTNSARNGLRLDYGINHYGRGDPVHGGKAKFYDTMSWFPDTSNKDSPQHSNRVADALVIYFADADTDQSPEDIGGISRGKDEWPIQHSFQKRAYKRHLLGYNSASLDASATWYPADPPTNEKWFVRKH